MHKFVKSLAESGKELKNVRVLTFCAMFAALAIVLQYVASINITYYIKIGFSGIPNQLVDQFFGPVTGALFAGVLDVIKYVMKPDGGFFFGFTFDAMLAAFIYGVFYYKKPIRLWRILLAKGLVCLIVNVGFATLWLSMLYGDSFIVLFPARAIKNLIMWPIDSLIFYIIVKSLEGTGIFKSYLVSQPSKDRL